MACLDAIIVCGSDDINLEILCRFTSGYLLALLMIISPLLWAPGMSFSLDIIYYRLRLFSWYSLQSDLGLIMGSLYLQVSSIFDYVWHFFCALLYIMLLFMLWSGCDVSLWSCTICSALLCSASFIYWWLCGI